MIDSAAVALLNKLVAESGATVVLSSSWRYSHTPAHMTRTLKAHGATFEVVDQTPLREDLVRDNRPSKCRGDEIDAWLQDHPGVESFVILDDSSDMGQHDWRLVKTSFEVGLTAEKVEQAMRFFRGEE